MTRPQKNTTTQDSELDIDHNNSGNPDGTATQEDNTIPEPNREESLGENDSSSTENLMIQPKETAEEPVGDDNCPILVEPSVEAGDLSTKPLETTPNEEKTTVEALDVDVKVSCSISPEMMTPKKDWG